MKIAPAAAEAADCVGALVAQGVKIGDSNDLFTRRTACAVGVKLNPAIATEFARLECVNSGWECLFYLMSACIGLFVYSQETAV